MRTALILSLLAWASLSLPIWQLSRTRALRPMAAKRAHHLEAVARGFQHESGLGSVVCFLAQLCSWAIGTLLNIFSTTAAAGVGPREHRRREGVRVRVKADHPLDSIVSSCSFYPLTVMQADGNGSGAYMHSGIRGGPHVGALRRCSFTNTESDSKRQSTSISRKPTCWLAYQQVLKVALLPSVLQLLP